MKCLIAHPRHCLGVALTRLAESRSDIIFAPLEQLPDAATLAAMGADAVIVPPLSDPGQAEPAEVYAHCDHLEALIDLCRQQQIALIWCVSDTLFEDGADTPIDETAMPAPRDETLRRLVTSGERLRGHPRHLVLRLGPLFGLDGEDSWLGPLIAALQGGETIRSAQDLIVCPTSVSAVARALCGILLQLDSGAGAWGTYHLCGVEPISRYTFVSVVKTQLATRLEGVGQTAALGELKALNQHHDTPLRRVLDCRRLLDVFGIHQKAWRVELGLMLDSWCQQHYGSPETVAET